MKEQEVTGYCLVIRDAKTGRESVWFEGMAGTRMEATRLAKCDVAPGHWHTMVAAGNWRVEKVKVRWTPKEAKL